MNAEPFIICIPDAALADLKARLQRARWTDAIAGANWDDGANVDYMRSLCAYWAKGFDWRAQEHRLNGFPQFKAMIDGSAVHFIHARGKGPKPLPIIVTHGWPSSFAEFSKLIPRLTDPVAFGGNAEDSFDVVVPSMPGYGFSERPTARGMTPTAASDVMAKLMTDVLGYDRFVAHGGDIGAGVTNRLGLNHGDRVAAIHAMAAPVPANTDNLTPAEQAYTRYNDDWERDEGAYGHQQRSKPQTLAIGLNDSPIGLAAWIVEKWRGWSECGGDVERSFTKDELLTQVSIYWFTETIGSSVRMYYESAHATRPPDHRRVETPARLFLTREKVDLCPPEWARRSYANLSYAVAEKGGHFLAAEEPELLSVDLRNWFRAFR